MTLKNDLLIRAAKGEQTERTPVWVMRQAGRILKEYREVRGKLSGFIELVQTPDLAAEVTIQPVDILGVDAAIIFFRYFGDSRSHGTAIYDGRRKRTSLPKNRKNRI
jgi:uroporphyrinogen-III decarboxylase